MVEIEIVDFFYSFFFLDFGISYSYEFEFEVLVVGDLWWDMDVVLVMVEIIREFCEELKE